MEPLSESVSAETSAAIEFEEMTSEETGFTLDIIGMEASEVESFPDATLSDLDQKVELEVEVEAEPAPVDTPMTMELTIEEPVDQAVECMPDVDDVAGSSDQLVASVIPDAPATAVTEPASMPSADLLSIDKALHLIAQGKADLLAPYLDALLQKVRPLMDFSTQVRRRKTEQHADDNA
jgi:hypothetical protein